MRFAVISVSARDWQIRGTELAKQAGELARPQRPNVSGPSARSYVDERVFDDAHPGNLVRYDGRDYKLNCGRGSSAVSILDLLFNVEGSETERYCRQ